MKARFALLLVFTLCLCLFAIPVVAQSDIYDNGPTDGTTDSWTVNFGFAVSDSFTLGSAATVTGLNFTAWIVPGDVMESAEVSMTSQEFGGTTYFDQTVDFTQSSCRANQYGFNVCNEQSTFSGPSLNAGTYWLTLQNAVVNSGDPMYWDESDGPSEASANQVGTIPSEAFTLLGTGSTTGSTGSTGSTPEPASIVLLSSGVLGIAGLVRRRFL